MGLKGPPGARQEEVVAVTPWPGPKQVVCRGPKLVEKARPRDGPEAATLRTNHGGICLFHVATLLHLAGSTTATASVQDIRSPGGVHTWCTEECVSHHHVSAGLRGDIIWIFSRIFGRP